MVIFFNLTRETKTHSNGKNNLVYQINSFKLISLFFVILRGSYNCLERFDCCLMNFFRRVGIGEGRFFQLEIESFGRIY